MAMRLHLIFVIAAVLSSVLGQNVIENIGFGQPTDSAKEGEREIVRIRLEPEGISEVVTGQIIPLSIDQYWNYTFTTERNLPPSVTNAIVDVQDPAEYDADKQDFNNNVINFTLSPGEDYFEIDMADIIIADDINEAEEQFILVLEYSSEAEVELDEDGGVLVVTILDDNPIVLVYNMSSYTFHETDGTVDDVIRVQKRIGSPPTEVDIPLIIVTTNESGSATAGDGGDYSVQNYIQTRTIAVNETEVILDPITINNDNFPEGNETFFLLLMKGDGTDALNIFPSTSPATMVIQDNDEVVIGFESEEYFVTEGDSQFVEVCVAVGGGQSLDHGYGSTVINVVINSGTATVGDYVASPSPNSLIIGRAQERMCVNITINDDSFVEGKEEFVVSLEIGSSTFSAGVAFLWNNVTIEISDNDGAIVGFSQTNYTGDEGETIEVCITVHSIDLGTISMSDFEGHFIIKGILGIDANASTSLLMLTASEHEQCINISLIEDSLVEETEALTLSLELIKNVSGIGGVEPSTTVITMRDGDSAVIGFNQSLLTIAEEDGDIVSNMCVQVMSPAIAPGVNVSYFLDINSLEVTQDIFVYPVDGVLTATISTVCHHITVVNNDVVEPDGKLVMTMNELSLNPPNTVRNVSEATVTIINDDMLQVYLEAFSTTVTEGGSLEFRTAYTGELHPELEVSVNVSAPSGSAIAHVDYEVDMGTEFTIILNSSQQEANFTVITVDDQILEDYKEEFGILIFLDSPSILAITDNDQNTYNVTILDNEELIVSFNESHSEVSEGDEGIHSIFLKIENIEMVEVPPGIFIAVVLEVQNMTSNATLGQDYSVLQQQVVFHDTTPESGLNVSIDVLGDTLVEGSEITNLTVADISISGLDNMIAAGLGAHGFTIFVINDDDDATLGIMNTSITTSEGNITICVGLQEGNLQHGLVIFYMVSLTDITTDVIDHKPLMEMGQIEATSTTQCHNIVIVDDNLVEQQEILDVNLVSVYNTATVQLSPNTSRITIEDSDSVYVGFEMAEYRIEEGDLAALVIRVIREDHFIALHGFNVSIELNETASSAVAGTDFIIMGGVTQTISFSPEEMYKDIEVIVFQDILGEGNEVMVLDLVANNNGNVINVGSHQLQTAITIIEDDNVSVSLTFNNNQIYVIEGEIFQFCVSVVAGFSSFLQNGFVDITVYTVTGTASGNDYATVPVPSSGTLNMTETQICHSIETSNDSIVEGVEDFRIVFEFRNKEGYFVESHSGNNIMIKIIDNDEFQLGFRNYTYEVGEEEGGVNDLVYIVKMNEDILQTDYIITLNVSHSQGPSAILGADFTIDPIMVKFKANETEVPISFTVINDTIEEGYENFTLHLSYDDTIGDNGAVEIVSESALISIRDDDVVTIGFEESVYIVVEGQEVQLCVGVLNKTLSNNETREFMIQTVQLEEYGATQGVDYVGITSMSNISRTTVTRQCYTLEAVDDDVDEEPERLSITGSAISSILEFHPNSAVVWIIDDESLVLPFPAIGNSNCTSKEISAATLAVVCRPPDNLPPSALEYFCSIDCGPLEKCDKTSAIDDSLSFNINLREIRRGNHTIEIVGFTHTHIVLRDVVTFSGQSDVFDLRCDHIESPTGIITVTCSAESVLTAFTCTVDNKEPYNCALQFEIDPDDFNGGSHTLTITATSQTGEIEQYKFSYDSSDPNTLEALVKERESIVAITVIAATFAIFVLLTLTICLLVFYHRRVNKYKQNSLERSVNLCYHEENVGAENRELTRMTSSESPDVPSQTSNTPSDVPQPTVSQPETDQIVQLDQLDHSESQPPSPQVLVQLALAEPVSEEPTVTLDELSKAYGLETWANMQPLQEPGPSESPEDLAYPPVHSGVPPKESIDSITEPSPEEPADFPLPTSSVIEATQPVDPAHSNLPMASTKLREQSYVRYEDKQPLLKDGSEVQLTKTGQKDTHSKQRKEEEGKSLTNKPTEPKPSGAVRKVPVKRIAVAGGKKEGHESMVSFWREKEEKYQQDRAQEWKSQ